MEEYIWFFNVEYDLSHKTRLIAGDDWTVNKKEREVSLSSEEIK